jgi:hypothetical protein
MSARHFWVGHQCSFAVVEAGMQFLSVYEDLLTLNSLAG